MYLVIKIFPLSSQGDYCTVMYYPMSVQLSDTVLKEKRRQFNVKKNNEANIHQKWLKFNKVLLKMKFVH